MRKVTVTIYNVREKLPEYGAMILADGGQEWHILCSEGTNIASSWEDDEPVRFKRWAYLGDLHKRGAPNNA